MSQAFPAPYIYPIDRASQNKALQQAGWGGMAGYGQNPNMYIPPVFPVSKAGAGRGGPSFLGGDAYNDALRASSRLGRQVPTPTRPPVPYSVDGAYNASNPTQMFSQPMAAMNELLPSMPSTSYSPIGANYGFTTNDQLAGMAGLREGRQGNYFGSPTLGELPSSGTGANTGWFDGLLGKGKEAWDSNKDWLVGDKNSIGAIPLGLGMFNAFNLYTYGKESIKSMREQNALARESFALNKAGALASLEDQYNKRNSNDMYHRNPNLSYADNVAAASSKTLEDMKRFK